MTEPICPELACTVRLYSDRVELFDTIGRSIKLFRADKVCLCDYVLADIALALALFKALQHAGNINGGNIDTLSIDTEV